MTELAAIFFRAELVCRHTREHVRLAHALALRRRAVASETEVRWDQDCATLAFLEGRLSALEDVAWFYGDATRTVDDETLSGLCRLLVDHVARTCHEVWNTIRVVERRAA